MPDKFDFVNLTTAEVTNSASQKIYTVGGPVQSGGGLYIKRPADDEIFELCRNSEYAFILSTRQVGKSSLMFQTIKHLKKEDIKSVVIDLQRFGAETTAEQWYLGLVDRIAGALLVNFDAIQWWQERAYFSHAERLTRFFQEVVLEQVKQPIVIFVDEIDTTFSLEFAADFFGVIRSLYVNRKITPEFYRLSFVLIGVANSNDLIDDPTRTPFNISYPVELTDFTIDQAMPLAQGFGLPTGQARQVLEWVLKWTGGHPFLTQRLCQEIAEGQAAHWTEAEVDRIVNNTFFGQQSWRDSNLSTVRDLLTRRVPKGYEEKVLKTYGDILQGRHPVKDERGSISKSHLKLTGVAIANSNNILKVRNPIYRQVFDEQWVQEHLQVNRSRRFLYAVVSLIAILFIISYYAWDRQEEAKNQRNIALSRELADYAGSQIDTDPELSFQLAARANRLSSTEQAVQALRKSLPQSLLQAELRGHTSSVTSANFSPDGKYVVTVSDDGTARVWEVQSGRSIAILQGHTESVTSANFSPDGEHVVTTSVRSANFSPDGKYVVTASNDRTARVWDVASNLITILQGHTDYLYSANFSPDGKYVVTASNDRTARVWEVPSGRSIAFLEGHSAPVTNANFSRGIL